jgi:hypothetical protein
MSDDSALVGNGYHKIAFFIQLALAGQAAVVSWIARTIHIVFFPVTHLRQQVFTLLDIYMAGTATAYAAAIVVELDIVIECHFQDTLSGGNVKLLLGLFSLLKSENNLAHRFRPQKYNSTLVTHEKM